MSAFQGARKRLLDFEAEVRALKDERKEHEGGRGKRKREDAHEEDGVRRGRLDRRVVRMRVVSL